MRNLNILSLCLGLLVLPVMLLAQGTDLGAIRGSVSDIEGGAIPGAKVRVTDTATDLSTELTTDQEGNYQASNLKYGEYKVTVSFPGFNTVEVLGVWVRSASVARADAKLAPSTLAQQVTVTTEASLVNMETPTVSGTLNSRQLLDLPRDSRDIYQFLYLNPNITYNPDDGFKFIGAQSWGANFTLDGQRATGGGFGEPTSGQPSLETVGELTVLSNNFTAEYAGIANIRVTTKRGEKDYHGTLFYDNKNSALAALPLQDTIDRANFLPTFFTQTFRKPTFNFTEFGGSFGGPIPKTHKKTFLMAAYERRYDARPVRYSSTSLPHQTVLNGDFSLIADSSKPVVPTGVTLTPGEIAANTKTVGGKLRFVTIPARLLNPVTSTLIKNYFPVTSPLAPINSRNGRLTEYAESVPGQVTRDLGTVRVDHDFNDRNKLYGTYNIQIPDGFFGPVGNPFKSLGTSVFDKSNHTLALSYTHIFSPRLFNEARGGFNNQHTFRRAHLKLGDFLKTIGFSPSDIDAYAAVVGTSALDVYGQFQLRYGPYVQFPSGARNADRRQNNDLITFGDGLTWITGRHSLKAGFDLVRNHFVDGFVSGRGSVRGTMTYAGNDINPLARFLLGLPADSVSFVQSIRPPLDVTNWEHGYYFQDDFKIHPRLTLNLGLRYEYISPFVDKNDLLVNFDPAFTAPDGTRGRFVVPSQNIISQIDPRMVAYGTTTAKDVGVGRGLVHGDKNNLAPRLGAAFRLNDKTSIRGGFGAFFPTSAAQGIRDAMASSPFNQGRTKTDKAPLSPWPRPMTGGFLRTSGTQPTVNAIPFDLESPRIEQFNVTVERQLSHATALRVSYLGTRMQGLIAGFDLNEIPPSDTPFGTTTGDGVTACDPINLSDCDFSAADLARRPFPKLGDFMLQYRNIGDGRSNALQVEVNRRYEHGLMFSASYMLLDQVSSGVDSNSSLGGTLWNQFDPGSDVARDGFVSRHRVIAYGSYELPFGRSRRYLSSMPRAAEGFLGAWQLSMSMFAKTGTGFTPAWECDDCGPVFPGNVGVGSVDGRGAGDFGGSYRATVNGNPYQRSGDKFWTPTVFGLPSAGADVFTNPQNAKRAFLDGPGSYAVNLAVRKNFRISEKARLSFTATFDNLFNHPLLSPVGDDGIADVGSFSMAVDPKTLKAFIDPSTVNPNLNFARLRSSFTQEGIDNRRSIRLSLRLTF